LCGDYKFYIQQTLIEGQIDDLKATPSIEARLLLIQELKWILRCGTDSEQKAILTKLEEGLGADQAKVIWTEAGTPFGDYSGTYSSYYGGAKGRLGRLGTSEVNAYNAFAFDPRKDDESSFSSSADAAATSAVPILTATDILYFYGHQYAQYNAPGVFANGTQTQFIDLRLLADKGSFGRVKLIISTSCATCCVEALNVFATLFPNTVILGYRKSAPIDGQAVRNDFDKGIQALKRPLLLDQPVDVGAIIGVWKSVVERHHPNERVRIPGYYQSGAVHYLEMGVWKSLPAADAANSCREKGSTIEEAVR
jgi:hypothetical protein